MADEDLDLDDGQVLDGPAPLRAAHKAEQKARAAAEKKADEALAELAQLRAERRTSNLESILEAQGGKKSWAKYIQGDATEEVVTAWLAADGAEDFGWQAPADGTPEEQAMNETARRISRTTATAPPVESRTGHTVDSIASLSDADLERTGWVDTNVGPNRPRPRRY